MLSWMPVSLINIFFKFIECSVEVKTWKDREIEYEISGCVIA